MRGLTPPDTTRNTAARPRLSLTVQLGLLGLLLLFALTLWLSRPLLGGIIDKSHQMRTQHLPELTRWRHNTQRVEQLYGFIETLYWTSDLQVARNSRLQAQVLVNSFAFPPDSPLAEQSGQLVDTIKRLAQLREHQRDLLGQLREQGHRLLAAPPTAEQHTEQHDQLLKLAAISTQMGVIGPDWAALQQEALLFRQQLQAPPASDQHAWLERLGAALGQLDHLAGRVAAERNLALELQRQLAATLNTDTALRTQQIADAVQADAEQIRRYSSLILLLLGVISIAVLYAFQRYLLRPILLCSQALEQLSSGQPMQQPPRTLFRELDRIGQSVRQYGEATHQLKHANQELMRLSERDGLTGLANRRHFDAVLANEYARACRHGHSLALILLDIDHFKRLNDRHGHLFGDDCLRRFAGILQPFGRRAGELAARYGGEEFALILPGLSQTECLAIAEQIRQQTADLRLQNEAGETVQFTLSAGLAYLADPRQQVATTLIQLADQALYRSKHAGRNRVTSVEAPQPEDLPHT